MRQLHPRLYNDFALTVDFVEQVNHIAELRALAKFYNFGDTLNLMIRDRLVCGINDENT